MQCERTVSGEITAFLSLIFVLLISFIFALLESATIQTTKNQKRLDVDRAIFSIFGEYQKELWKEYEVFALMLLTSQDNTMRIGFWTGLHIMEVPESNRRFRKYRC